MRRKYIVRLSEEERQSLKELVSDGTAQSYRIKHAQILLKLDEIPENYTWTYRRIGEAFDRGLNTICQIARRYVTEGLEASLSRKAQTHCYKKADEYVKASIVAIACSAPPEGHKRWTLQMIADDLVRRHIVKNISDSTVLRALKQAGLNYSSIKKKATGDFVCPQKAWRHL